MSRQVISGTTNQTDPNNVYCDFNGVRYPSTITAGVWQIVIPRKAMALQPATKLFTVDIKNSIGDIIRIRKNAKLKLPEPPTDLQVKEVAQFTLAVSWVKPESKDRIHTYQVLINGVEINHGNVDTVTVIGVPNGVKQIVQVRSQNDLGIYSAPATIEKTLYFSAVKLVKVTSQTSGEVPAQFAVTWEDTAPQQWETWVKVWKVNSRKPLFNTKHLRGTNTVSFTNYISGDVLNVEVLNVPENRFGTGPDYKHVQRCGVQQFQLTAKF